MQAKFGQILCSAPTHVAVDDFANRLDQITRSIAEEYNKGKKADDPSRLRHRFMLRVFTSNNELRALRALLEKPDAIDAAGKTGYRSPDSRLLLEAASIFSLLLATGNISYAEYSKLLADGDAIYKGFMTDMINKADLLCTTPANTTRKPIPTWKQRFASGVAIDEAGNMNRADLYSVWGNTLLPCFLFGHPLHPPDITPNYQGGPTFMTTNEKDGNGNFLNRFAADGGVSPLAFFVATGIPVYRLKTQP
ncbi:unnamed protein product [Fusarium graminearum]|nr:unnamed protein product [Fusarium graminearum]